MSQSDVPADAGWYLSFFDELPVAFWRAVVTPGQTRAELDWLRTVFAGPRLRLLDLACGDGRHARGLAASGHRVTAIDISEHQLALARREPGSDKVDWRLQDMAKLDFAPGSFDGAYCFGNSFGYLERDATESLVAAIAHSLRPGGRFALDSGSIAESIQGSFEPHSSGEVGGIGFEAWRSYDEAGGAMTSRYRFTRGSEVADRVARHLILGLDELRRMLERHGLDLVRTESDTDGSPFGPGSRRLLGVAIRG